MTRLTGSLVALVVLTSSHAVFADRAALRVGEVAASAPQVAAHAKSDLADEITHLRLPRVRRASIVSMSVLKLTHSRVGRDRHVECVVSATLRDAHRGTLYAILQGRAQAPEGTSRSAMERAVLRGAIHGAVEQIPRALEK